MLEKFKFKPVDPSVVEHPIEHRGFVEVPFDYFTKASSEKIKIFYRLIPAYGSKADDSSKPIIVVINGGPGIPSSVYRALDFDYQNEDAPQNGPLNRFKYFLKTHRVLIVDQRGTNGQSSPLDMDEPALDVNAVAKYFSSDSQARDYLAVIEKVIPKNEPFLMIAQSYGGMVGMQYLSLEHARKPLGIIFSCSALPYENVMPAFELRRKEQLKLNRELKEVYPDIESRLTRLRDHLQKSEINPDHVNGLFEWLGKNVKGVWEKGLIDHMDSLLLKGKEDLEKIFHQNQGSGNLLNYILSSANFSPGQTDRTMAAITSRSIPFEPWMIDENWVWMQTGSGSASLEKIISEMDQVPPPATPFLSVEDLREKISQHQLVFVAADNDAFVPSESYLEEVKKFQVLGHTEVQTLPGGHHAIFLEKGYQIIETISKNV